MSHQESESSNSERPPEELHLSADANPSEIAGNQADRGRTGPISLEQQEFLARTAKQVEGFEPVPEPLADEDGNSLPRWRVSLDIDTDPPESFGFDIYGPLTLGREADPQDSAFLDLESFNAVASGVSRRHLELRPAPHGLFAVDLNSLNGTYKNGVRLKPNSPTPLGNRDTPLARPLAYHRRHCGCSAPGS